MMLRLTAILLAASAATFGADREFDRVVKGIESHYRTRRTHIPLMGVANLFVKVGHPAGASSLQVAIFQDLDSAPEYGDADDLDRLMNSLSKDGLHPLVRVRSRGSGEATYILTGEVGKSTRILIATFQRREATVVEAKVDIDTLMKLIASPGTAGDAFAVKERWDP
ncbi:MAG TPA: hypothetical protein VGH38_17470 [Bryobacteraceae bacterium]|jgi:hypothetical protein